MLLDLMVFSLNAFERVVAKQNPSASKSQLRKAFYEVLAREEREVQCPFRKARFKRLLQAY